MRLPGRLIMVGENRLAEHQGRPAVLRFLDQFRSVLMLVLIGAAVLAGLVGELKDTVVITVGGGRVRPHRGVRARGQDRRRRDRRRWLWLALGTVLLLQIAAVHIPWLQAIFDTVHLTLSQWAICAGIALTVLVLEESIRLLARTRDRAQPRPKAGRHCTSASRYAARSFSPSASPPRSSNPPSPPATSCGHCTPPHRTSSSPSTPRSRASSTPKE